MRKVLAVILVCIASAFAAWDYFPVIGYGKGEAKLAFEQWRQGNDRRGTRSDFKIRYSPVENLELMSRLGYILGARYQIMPVLSAGLDLGFPIPSTAWSFTPNVQFSTPLTEAIVLGSNAQATIYTEDANNNTHGMDLRFGAELNLIKGQNIIRFGCDFNREDLDNDNGGLEIVPMVGYVATPGNLLLGTNIGMKFGEDAGHDNYETFIGLDFSIKF